MNLVQYCGLCMLIMLAPQLPASTREKFIMGLAIAQAIFFVIGIYTGKAV